jgi:hypothetical protein
VAIGAIVSNDDRSAAKTFAPSTTTSTSTTATTAPRPVPRGTSWDGSARIFRGDQTLVYRGEAGSLRLRYGGGAAFRVTAYGPDGDGPDDVVDEPGAFRGRVAIGHGPVTLVIDTGGGYWGAVVDGRASSG